MIQLQRFRYSDTGAKMGPLLLVIVPFIAFGMSFDLIYTLV